MEKNVQSGYELKSDLDYVYDERILIDLRDNLPDRIYKAKMYKRLILRLRPEVIGTKKYVI